jgi:hypothetical protein
VQLLPNLRRASLALAFGLFAIQPTGVSRQAEAQRVEYAPAPLSTQELFKRLSPSIFIVEVLDKNGFPIASGSGVAVASDQVATNKHVIEAGVAFRIKQGRKTWPAAITYVDPDHDSGTSCEMLLFPSCRRAISSSPSSTNGSWTGDRTCSIARSPTSII